MKHIPLLILLLTLNPNLAQPNQPATQPFCQRENAQQDLERYKKYGGKEFIQWVEQCGEKHKVKPSLILAVARIESGNKHNFIRFGSMGSSKFVGPMGLSIDCKIAKIVNIYNWKNNVEIGTISLKPHKKEKTTNDILKRYNPKWTTKYLKDIRQLCNQIDKEKIFNN